MVLTYVGLRSTLQQPSLAPPVSLTLSSVVFWAPPVSSVHFPYCISALDKPQWITLQDIDLPLRQRALSRVIDESSYDTLLNSAPDSRSRALALSCAIPHAGDRLNVIPSSALGLHLLDCEFRPCTGWVSQSSQKE